MAIKDGGPAFPCLPITTGNGDSIVEASGGMSLRDYFAGQMLVAMQGEGRAESHRDNEEDEEVRKLVASDCYEMADAMLRRRSLP